MKHLKHILLLALCGTRALLASTQTPLFTYDVPENATQIHVTMSGIARDTTPWCSRNVTHDDRQTLRHLYGNQTVMANFGAGTTLSDTHISARLDAWTTRAADGLPVGGWIIESMDETCQDKIPYGLMAAGLHNTPGWCEISRMILRDHQHHGLGSSIMKSLVQTWAPQTRWHGEHDPRQNVRDKFSCFNGLPLQKLYVSAAPANERSWGSQRSAGFTPQDLGQNPRHISLAGLPDIRTYDALDGALQEHFTTSMDLPETDENALKADTLYAFTDHNGLSQSVSFVKNYSRMRFHMTYDVPQISLPIGVSGL